VITKRRNSKSLSVASKAAGARLAPSSAAPVATLLSLSSSLSATTIGASGPLLAPPGGGGGGAAPRLLYLRRFGPRWAEKDGVGAPDACDADSPPCCGHSAEQSPAPASSPPSGPSPLGPGGNSPGDASGRSGAA